MKTYLLFVIVALTLSNIALGKKCHKSDKKCNNNLIGSNKQETKSLPATSDSNDFQTSEQHEHKKFKEISKNKKYPKFKINPVTESYNQKSIFNSDLQLTENKKLRKKNHHHSKNHRHSKKHHHHHRVNDNEIKSKFVDINEYNKQKPIYDEVSLLESPAFYEAKFDDFSKFSKIVSELSPFLHGHSALTGEAVSDKIEKGEWKENVALKKLDEKLTSKLKSAHKMLQLPRFVSSMQNPIFDASSHAESVTRAFKKINEKEKSLWKTLGASADIFANFNISEEISDNMESSKGIFNNFENFSKSIHQFSDRFSKMLSKMAKAHKKVDKLFDKSTKKCRSLEKDVSIESLVESNASCVVCKAITSIIYFQVKFANATIEIIEKAVQKVCNVFPYAKDECDFFLKHIDEVVQLILKGLSTQKICEELKFCNGTSSEGKFMCEDGVVEKKKSKVGEKLISRVTSWINSEGFGCSTCKFVGKAIHVVMESTNSTNEMIAKQINDTCSLFASASETCDHYVTKGEELVKLIRSQMKPVDACKKIMKCNNDMSYSIFQSVISEHEGVENTKSEDSSESTEIEPDIEIESPDEINKIEEPLVKSDSQNESSRSEFVPSL